MCPFSAPNFSAACNLELFTVWTCPQRIHPPAFSLSSGSQWKTHKLGSCCPGRLPQKPSLPDPLWKAQLWELAVIFLKLVTNVCNIVKARSKHCLRVLDSLAWTLLLACIKTLPSNFSASHSSPVTQKAGMKMDAFLDHRKLGSWIDSP